MEVEGTAPLMIWQMRQLSVVMVLVGKKICNIIKAYIIL